jgi:hypothetical protein
MRIISDIIKLTISVRFRGSLKMFPEWLIPYTAIMMKHSALLEV